MRCGIYKLTVMRNLGVDTREVWSPAAVAKACDTDQMKAAIIILTLERSTGITLVRMKT